jgi:hypothetical protein
MFNRETSTCEWGRDEVNDPVSALSIASCASERVRPK